MKKLFVPLFLIMMNFVVMKASINVNAQLTTDYVYIFQSEDFRLIVRTPDRILFNLPAPSVTSYLSNVLTSPNKDLAALIFSEYPIRTIALLNLETGTLNVLPVTLPPENTLSITDSTQMDAAWSPDGRYLAINVRTTEDFFNDIDTLIYDVSLNTTFKLTNDQQEQSYLSWSPDSSEIAIFQDETVNSTPRSMILIIIIYNIITKNVVKSIIIAELNVTETYRSTILCRLGWSPDMINLDFNSSCIRGTGEDPTELYIAGVEQAAVKKITNFVTDFLPPYPDSPYNPRFADYFTYWIDSRQLLVGAQFSKEAERGLLQYRTLLYDTSSNLLTDVDNSLRFNWAVNPANSNLFAFSARDEQTTSVQIANFDGTQFTIIQSVAGDGYHLEWSPDGRILAFVADQQLPYRDNYDTVGFISLDDGELASHEISYPQPIFNHTVFPIGWLSTVN